MILRAIVNSNPHDGLWSQLKSMQYALERASELSHDQITNLDKERLTALTHFFEPPSKNKPTVFSLAGSDYQSSPNNSFHALGLDPQKLIKELPEFENWHSQQKLGFEKKWQKLAEALEKYLFKESDVLLLPQQEIEILQKIISKLLVRAELALYA